MQTRTNSSNGGIFARGKAGTPSGAGGWGVGINRQAIAGGLLVFAGYYLGSQLGLALTFKPIPVSVMWPPNSILLAALLLSPYRRWWLMLACAFPAHLIAEMEGGVPLRMILCWFVSNCSEALIGAWSARVLIGPAGFDRMRSIGILLLCGGLLGPFLSSFLDAGFVALNHWGQQSYWQVWRIRFCSNVFTALTIAPVIVTWGTNRLTLRSTAPRRLLEAALVMAGLLTVSFIIFCWQPAGPATLPPLLYAPLPFLLWIAVRFGPTGTSTAILSVGLLAIWGAVHGHGPFASHSPAENTLAIQVFFVVVAITFMFLSASTRERARAEERFAKAFRSSPDAMIVTRKEDGYIIEVNRRWEKFFGYRRDETVGRTMVGLNIYISEADRERLLARVAADATFQDMQLNLRLRHGEVRHTSISARSDEIEGVECLILVIRDLTDRKRAEEAQRNLAHVSRLALVGELTAMVAHEVNQPLGAILSNADAAEMLMERENPPLDEIRRIIADIKKNEARADATIRRMQVLMRNRQIQLEPMNLNETVADVLELVAGDAIRRRVQLQPRLSPNLPPALGDRGHLQHVLLNLIVNGMDAMTDIPESGRGLLVETRENDRGELEVLVVDRGFGVRPGDTTRIFESFFTTKKDGMGMGLAISRSIIEAHHGRIWVEKDATGGAAFHFTVQPVKDAGHAANI
jgi:two-component system sensor kinase FixL